MSKELVIAHGKSVTSRKGIVSEGQQVTADYFTHGQKTLDELVEKGFVMTVADYKKALHLMGKKGEVTLDAPAPEEESLELKLGVKKAK